MRTLKLYLDTAMVIFQLLSYVCSISMRILMLYLDTAMVIFHLLSNVQFIIHGTVNFSSRKTFSLQYFSIIRP